MSAHAPNLPCPQCSAPIQIRDEPRLNCAHCSAALYLDLRGYLLHAFLRPQLDKRAAVAALTRYLDSIEVAGKPRAMEPKLVFFPFFSFDTSDGPKVVPATSDLSTMQSWRGALAPADLLPYDAAATQNARVVDPEVTIGEAASRAGAATVSAARLVHVPFWEVRYQSSGHRFAATVSALDGAVDADPAPPSSAKQQSARYLAWTAAAFIIFFLESLLIPGGGPSFLAVGLSGLALWWVLENLVRGRS